MGQGTYTKIAQLAAHALGLHFSKIKVSATRTDKVPNTSASAASSSTRRAAGTRTRRAFFTSTRAS